MYVYVFLTDPGLFGKHGVFLFVFLPSPTDPEFQSNYKEQFIQDKPFIAPQQQPSFLGAPLYLSMQNPAYCMDQTLLKEYVKKQM